MYLAARHQGNISQTEILEIDYPISATDKGHFTRYVKCISYLTRDLRGSKLALEHSVVVPTHAAASREMWLQWGGLSGCQFHVSAQDFFPCV